MTEEQFNRIIELGINREEEAHGFYNYAASRVDNKVIKQIFKELAEDELGHRELLLRFKADPKLPGKLIAPDVDYFLAEETELPDLSENMKPADALALAMKKEEQAVEFYRKLADQTEDTEMKKLCLDIAKMELNHKHKLEDAYTDVAYIEAF